MADYGMSKNGSGYKDETAYKALMGMAKPGDVWMDGEKLVLILKNQGAFCNILMLREENVHRRMIEIVSGKTYYTDPAMVKYTFCERLGQFVQKLPRDVFARVLDEVANALNFESVKPKSRREMCHELLDKILDRAGGN